MEREGKGARSVHVRLGHCVLGEGVKGQRRDKERDKRRTMRMVEGDRQLVYK